MRSTMNLVEYCAEKEERDIKQRKSDDWNLVLAMNLYQDIKGWF